MDQINTTKGLAYTQFEEPDSVVERTVCTSTGKLAVSGCPAVTEYFDRDTAPTQSCSGHRSAKKPSSDSKKDDESSDSSDQSDSANQSDSHSDGNSSGSDSTDLPNPLTQARTARPEKTLPVKAQTPIRESPSRSQRSLQ